MSKPPKVSKQLRRKTWYLVYRPRGKPKQVWEPVGHDENIAERKRLEKMVELMDDGYVEPSRDTFESIVNEWWRLIVVNKYAESTTTDYRSMLNRHLLPAFGSRPVSKIKYKDVQEFVARKQSEGLSAKRIRNMLSLLSSVFDYASKADYCVENPVDKVDRPSCERHEVIMDFERWMIFISGGNMEQQREPVDRVTLMADVALLGEKMSDRTFGHLIRALGLRARDTRLLGISVRGRTKLYYPEAAWAIRTIAQYSISELKEKSEPARGELREMLDPYRAIAERLQKTIGFIEFNEAHLNAWRIPNVKDTEFLALLLFAFSWKHGLDPKTWQHNLREAKGWQEVSSFGPVFIKYVVEGYFKTYGEYLGLLFELEGKADEELEFWFAATLVENIGTMYQHDAFEAGVVADAANLEASGEAQFSRERDEHSAREGQDDDN